MHPNLQHKYLTTRYVDTGSVTGQQELSKILSELGSDLNKCVKHAMEEGATDMSVAWHQPVSAENPDGRYGLFRITAYQIRGEPGLRACDLRTNLLDGNWHEEPTDKNPAQPA